MRAGLRFGIAAIAALVAVAPRPLLAQEAAAANDTAASERVGPRELEGFSLNGTVTRQAEPQPVRTDPQPRQTPAQSSAADPAPASSPPVARTETPRPRPAEPAQAAPSGQQPAPVATPSLDSFTPAPEAAPVAAPAVTPSFSKPAGDPAPLLAEQRPSPLPWLLALAFALGAAAFLFWRQRSQRELATAGPSLASAAHDPEPARARPQARAPVPQPHPPGPPAAAPGRAAGIVSTRLRPWIEIEFTPTRCIVEEQRAIIQFDVAMFNSGSAPARDLLLEMGIFNAGPTQEEEIGRFQAMPAGDGPRVPIIEPLRRVERSSQIAVALDKLRVFEAKGRRFFVPMLALNASYRWSGGEGRSSASFLVGRDGKDSEKMAPFRLDLGPRVFRGLGAREHHLRVRV